MHRYLRRKKFRPYRRGIPPIIVPILIALGLSAGFFRLVSLELRPIIETVAVSQSTNLISELVSGAVDECLSERQMGYSDFITMETAPNGKVLSLTGRPGESSSFKRLVTERIAARLNNISLGELDIPIGNLTGSIFLTGFGPEIRVKVYSIGEVTATYSNSFSAAGVNQTHHGVYLNIAVTIHLLIPGEIIPVTVTDQICVAETIILGDVPNTYIHLEKGAD